MYERPDDWDGDPSRSNPEVHYRLYSSTSSGVTVICVQDFDYPGYDARQILSPDAWPTEANAERALARLLPEIASAEASLPTTLSAGMHARMLAAAVRPEAISSLQGEPTATLDLTDAAFPLAASDIHCAPAQIDRPRAVMPSADLGERGR